MASRLLNNARSFLREAQLIRMATADRRSFVRCLTDFALYRGLVLPYFPGRDRERTIALKEGPRIRYRLNRGDIQSIREVWLEQCYRLPVEIPLRVVIDLGANIGLTSLWYATHYPLTTLVSVEPVVANAELVRQNLSHNSPPPVVLQAAVGGDDGEGAMLESRASNLGQLTEAKGGIRIMSMQSVLGHLPPDQRIDLVKIDIEGSEQRLLEGDLDWLTRVSSLIVEFHPDLVDYPGLVAAIKSHGFEHVPAGRAFWNSMDFFLRRKEDESDSTLPAQRGMASVLQTAESTGGLPAESAS